MQINAEQQQRIIELSKLGVTQVQIAKEINCSRSTIYRFLKKYKEEPFEPKDDLIGKKFNKLTILSQAPSIKGKIQYYCQCDCGRKTTVSKQHLLNGHTKSCGCLKQKITDGEDLTNQRFGRLIAKKRIRQNNITFWECICDCGNIHYVRTGDLISGGVKSCGCLKSYGEEQIASFLNKFNISYKKEYSFTDLKGNARCLRFDFAIFINDDLNCLIEYQGEQHYNPTNRWYSQIILEYDNKKREYCKNNNLILYEFTKDTNIETELLKILKERGLIDG